MNEMMNFEGMSLEQLTELNNQVMFNRMNMLQEMVKQMQLERAKDKTALNIELESIKNKVGNVQETAHEIQMVTNDTKNVVDQFVPSATEAFVKVKGITDELKEEIAEVKQIQIASTRVRQPRYEYVSQGDFGRHFNVSISSVRIGKLLKIVGLAQPSKGKLAPYRQYVNSGHAIRRDDEKYTHHHWHFQKCLKKIDKWLDANNHLTRFYSITETKELDRFIDGLYNKYIIDKENK